MRVEFAEALHFDEGEEISFSRLIELSGLPEADVRDLVDYGALAPVDPHASSWTFRAHSVILARTACRLRNDFELDTHALSVVLGFVERLEAVENELRAVRARSSGSR